MKGEVVKIGNKVSVLSLLFGNGTDSQNVTKTLADLRNRQDVAIKTGLGKVRSTRTARNLDGGG